MPDEFGLYRKWFYAAAIYNALWGTLVVLFPFALFDLLSIPRPETAALFQVIGMMVGVYAYGYYLLARDPVRYCGLIWIGLAGKTFGPVGFLWSYLQGELPLAFGWILVFNDLIWWPVFWMFALKHARKPL